MNTKETLVQFKPSTYCDNVSEPLRERIKELEKELAEMKKQVRTLKFEKAFHQQSPVDEFSGVDCYVKLRPKRDRTRLIDRH